MREELANLVYPVLTRALDIKDRLARGDEPELHVEQVALKGLLQSDAEARRVPDFGGEVDMDALRGAGLFEGNARKEIFHGVRYALTCWLDEMFILDTPWEMAWNEQKLEMALYGTNDRAWKFWEQAHLAERRPDSDAVEAFYLCVMLGFRGTMGEEPEKLRAWATAIQGRIARGQAMAWEPPPEVEPATDVPPLLGRRQLQRMVVLAGGVFLFASLVITGLLVWSLGH